MKFWPAALIALPFLNVIARQSFDEVTGKPDSVTTVLLCLGSSWYCQWGELDSWDTRMSYLTDARSMTNVAQLEHASSEGTRKESVGDGVNHWFNPILHLSLALCEPSICQVSDYPLDLCDLFLSTRHIASPSPLLATWRSLEGTSGF